MKLRLVGLALLIATSCTRPERPKAPRYDGPLFDAVTQWGDGTARNAEHLIARARAAQVGRVVFCHRRPDLPSGSEEQSVRLAARHGDFILIGAPKYFKYADEVTEENITALVQGIKKHSLKLICEIMFRHADKRLGDINPGGERIIDPESPLMKDLFKKIAPFKIPLLVHWELYDWKNDEARIRRMLAAHPNQTFVLAHLGYGSPEQMETLFSKHPNLMGTISKKDVPFDYYADRSRWQGPALLDDQGVLREDWKKFLISYSDRILFGTDAHKDYMWNPYSEVVGNFRKILGQVPPDVAEKIGYKNAEKLYRSPLAPR